MKRNIFILSVLFVVLSWTINAQQRIIGGSNANISEAPWQVLIQISNGEFGGGSIIAPNVILTAAHVVEVPRQPRRNPPGLPPTSETFSGIRKDFR